MNGIYIFSVYENFQRCKVFNYSLDTSKFMKAQGWLLEGTYYNHLTFIKYN